MSQPMRLGELLVRKGYLSPARLESALRDQVQKNEFLGAILVRKGWIREPQLLEALSEQSGIPFVELKTQSIDWAVSMQFPPALLNEQTCFPIQMDPLQVTVAICNPLDVWATSDLEKAARGRELKLVLATQADILNALAHSHELALKKMGSRLAGGPDAQ